MPDGAPRAEASAWVAFADGEVVPLTQVDDPVFSEGMLGPGVAIRPASGEVVAPLAGTVTMVAETRHAIGITSDSGIEVLLHLGLETVALGGDGMTCLVAPGDRVEPGQPVATVDWDGIRERIDSTDVILVITRLDGPAPQWVTAGTVTAGRSPLTVEAPTT